MPKTPPKVPLSITLDTISLKGFTKDSSGGTSPIAQYDGSPLYCHAVETAPDKIDITFDLTAPSTFTPNIGFVNSITVAVGMPGTGLTFKPAGAVYTGGRLGYFLELSDDLSTATLRIEQPPDAAASDGATLGLIILGAKVTDADKARGYFVDVPIGKNFEAFDAMTIYWSPGGGLAGPIGGGVIPPSGP